MSGVGQNAGVSVPQRGLVPQPGERGLASAGAADVAALVDGAWAGLLTVAEAVDLTAPSRLAGWTAHDVLVHLGAWDGLGEVGRDVDDARTGRVRFHDDVDARNATLVAEHHDATRDEVLAALGAARQRAASLLAAPDADVVGLRWVGSVVGELPLAGLLAAQGYELAVHALDLAPAGAPAPPPGLLDAGVGAVVDVVGALAARRGLDGTFAVLTPTGRWATSVRQDSWTTTRLDPSIDPAHLRWPGLEGGAADVLDAIAGRVPGAQLVLTRRIRLHGVPGLLRLLPALDAVPGAPGGSALQATVRGLASAQRLVGRAGARVGAGVGAAVGAAVSGARGRPGGFPPSRARR
jgi:uncharacterized protein (TIGR03083 family)